MNRANDAELIREAPRGDPRLHIQNLEKESKGSLKPEAMLHKADLRRSEINNHNGCDYQDILIESN